MTWIKTHNFSGWTAANCNLFFHSTNIHCIPTMCPAHSVFLEHSCQQCTKYPCPSRTSLPSKELLSLIWTTKRGKGLTIKSGMSHSFATALFTDITERWPDNCTFNISFSSQSFPFPLKKKPFIIVSPLSNCLFKCFKYFSYLNVLIPDFQKCQFS